MSRIYDALKKAEHEAPSGGTVSAVATAAAIAIGDASSPDPAAVSSSVEPESDLLVTADFATRSWDPDLARLIFTDSSHEGFGIEQFRSLRSRLYQLRAKKNMTSVLVCSALSGEGKTFVSANLALALAKQRGRKVLLIDADLRKPTLNEVFGAPAGPGLSEHLAGTAELKDIIQAGSIENLWLVPGGAPAPNAAELLENRRLNQLLQRLAPLFDWIVLDSSPVGPVRDAVTISRCCDAVLLVALAGVTPYFTVQKAQREFRDGRVLGLVLNGAKERPHHSPYYYGGYGYGKKTSGAAKGASSPSSQ